MHADSKNFDHWVAQREKDGWGRKRIEAHLAGWGWHQAATKEALDSRTLAEAANEASRPGRVGPRTVEGYGATIDAGDRVVDVAMFMRRPHVVLFSGFLSTSECEMLIEESRSFLRRSEVVNSGDVEGGSVTSYARTSETAFLSSEKSVLVAALQRRVSKATGYPEENFEEMQVSKYVPGEEFAPHHDYFDTASLSSRSAAKLGEQRVATMLLYLSKPEAGGTTIFSDVELEIVPQVGSALLFSYEQADDTSLTLHGGAPVMSGEKWIGTIFIRDAARPRNPRPCDP